MHYHHRQHVPSWTAWTDHILRCAVFNAHLLCRWPRSSMARQAWLDYTTQARRAPRCRLLRRWQFPGVLQSPCSHLKDLHTLLSLVACACDALPRSNGLKRKHSKRPNVGACLHADFALVDERLHHFRSSVGQRAQRVFLVTCTARQRVSSKHDVWFVHDVCLCCLHIKRCADLGPIRLMQHRYVRSHCAQHGLANTFMALTLSAAYRSAWQCQDPAASTSRLSSG